MRRFTLLLTLFLTVAIVRHAAGSICVEPTGANGCFTTVQAAVDAADGATSIFLAPGDYAENVVIGPGAKVEIFALAGPARLVGDGTTSTLTISGPRTKVGLFFLGIENGSNEDGGGGLLVREGAKVEGAFVDVRGNAAPGGRGGGILCERGQVRLGASTVHDNAAAYGGNVYAERKCKLQLHSSAVYDGTAEHVGGGIHFGGKIVLIHTTLRDNGAGGQGGGLYSHEGRATVRSSTITGNTASTGPGILASWDGVKRAKIKLQTSVVAQNGSGASGDDCAVVGEGKIVSRGFNALGACDGPAVRPTDLAVVDPMLGSPDPDGHRTPLVGSPLIDAVARKALCRFADARGVPREAPCEIGAVELYEGP